MVTIPLTVLDNFFDNPQEVKDYALSLKYSPEPDGKWPGKRTENLINIHFPFYKYVCNKVLSLFFENPVNHHIDLKFQLIEDYQGKGWVHQDPTIFTFLIYLHKENPEIDCGTTLWNLDPNLLSPINSENDHNLFNSRREHHKTKKTLSKDQSLQYKKFKKSISIPDKFNRFIGFSSEHFHSANSFDNNISSRLTLIGFVENLNTSKLPIIRSKQVLL
jgi:hypothetical protein